MKPIENTEWTATISKIICPVCHNEFRLWATVKGAPYIVYDTVVVEKPTQPEE